MEYRRESPNRCTSNSDGKFVIRKYHSSRFQYTSVWKHVSKPAGDKGDIKTMKASLQLRWLIIDEIHMVSARLLADVDTKLRNYARAVDPRLKDANKHTRPFAGINLLCS